MLRNDCVSTVHMVNYYNFRCATIKRQHYMMQVNGSATVLDIKKQIERVSSIPVKEQRLMLNGRPLSGRCRHTTNNEYTNRN